MLTKAEITLRLAEITTLAKDNLYDEAHIKQDQLYCDVLLAIANGAPDAVELARTALVVREIRFKRYYA